MSSAPFDSAGLFVIGATHHRTPLEVRERLALAEEAIDALRAERARIAGLREFAVLNTCNRVEFYGVADTPAAVAAVQQAYCARQRFAVEEFEKFRLSLDNREAIQHLL